MKERFTTIDLLAVLQGLKHRLLGMRLVNVYDIDQKTYLLKLARPDEKVMLLFESGCRLHTTEFEWPKNMQPSGFSMKCRKHLRTRRLVSLTQLGVDRVVDMQFGSGEAAYHLILELYDRGNVILTDHAYTILNLLRLRTDTDTDTRFAVRETFTMDTIKQEQPLPTSEMLQGILFAAKLGDQLKHLLNPQFVYGSALLSHCLIGAGFSENVKIGSGFDPASDLPRLMSALQEADGLYRRLRDEPSKGYLIQKREVQPLVDAAAVNGEGGEIFTNLEFHPMLFRQHLEAPYKEFETFDKAVDEFFSSRSSQKQDIKSLHMQKTAVKKLDNIRKDHQRRLDTLKQIQEEDAHLAQLIELNLDLVEKAILVIRSAVASAMDWGDIELLVKDAQGRGDPVALAIHSLKLRTNEITLLLRNPTEDEEEELERREGGRSKRKKASKGIKVDIDLGLSPYANARKYYDHKRQAARKENKTMDASGKALKSAEKKAKQALKDISTATKILKARKTHWFEKFYWFISSENYLVIGGRDQQQNELVVKKYLKDGDVYVHADLHGATSVVVKNPSGDPIPPKTLNEAGFMAVCYSTAWEARIVISAWWVYHHQVSKTAPTGEYLTTGSFMIRGKKNFLPPCQLVLGFAFLFRVDDSCIPNHLHERRVREAEDDEVASLMSQFSEPASEATSEATLPDSLEEDESDNSAEESDEEEDAFPNTTIQLQHVEGDRYELQRGTSVASSQPDESEERQVDTADLGDSQPLPVKGEERRYQHMSAKQRKHLRKQAKQLGGSVEEPSREEPKEQPSKKQPKSEPAPPVQQPPQSKRGQKTKQKRMKEKYGDQDEEERQLRMEILASAGAAKEKKPKGKKQKKKDPTQSSNPKQKYYQRTKNKSQPAIADPTHKQKAPLLVPMAEVVQKEREQDALVVGMEGEGGGGSSEKATLQEPLMVVEDLEDGLDQEVEDDGGASEEEDRTDVGELEVANDPVNIQHSDRVQELSSTADVVRDTALVAESKTTADSAAVELSMNQQGLTESSSGDDVTVLTESVTGSEGAVGSDAALQQPHQAPELEESDDEEKSALLAEENILQLEEADKEQLSILDSFTGCPLPEDILLYCIPVCAPYTAVLSYKYKVKLVPGTNRRGKAAKAALHRFVQSRESTQREKDLLKSIKDTDLSRYIPGKVKMTLPLAYKQQRK